LSNHFWEDGRQVKLKSLGRQLLLRMPWRMVAVFGGVLAVYLRTLSPGVLGGDVGELQFVPYILGLAHPTGTPFLVLLGWLWTKLPLGQSVAWQMNLLAAISASLAVAAVFQIVYWRGRRLVPALVAALSLAFGAVFWEQATMADKYALNALFVALVLLLALRWGQTSSPRTLYLLAFTYGLSLTHHRTMLLFAPFLLAYVWWKEKGALWRDRGRLPRLVALLLLPLLFYLYLPWAESRNLPPGTWHPRALADWYVYFADMGFVGSVYVDAMDLIQRLQVFAQMLTSDFTAIGVALGLAGLLWQWRSRPADAAFLLAGFLVHGFLAANYHVPRQWTYFLPCFVVFAIWIGEGARALWMSIESPRLARPGIKTLLAMGLALLLLALPLASFPERYRSFRDAHLGAGVLDVWRQSLKQGDMAERLGAAIAGVERNAVIVTDWEQATPLWYYQQVEGLRPDVEIVYPIERLEEAAASGRPVYISRNYANVAGRWHLSSVGPLIALEPRPGLSAPPGMSPLNIQMGDAFQLLGFTYGKAEFQPATVVPLTLHWQALRAPEFDYSVSLRLMDEGGRAAYTVDSQHPVLGTYPTSLWTEREVVSDYYEIPLRPGLPPGAYRWGVVLYRALPGGGWENLKVGGANDEMAMGGQITVRER
jgi:hypothetical protein